MELELQNENEDGSADYHINLTAEEQAQVFRFGLIEMLKRMVEEGKQYDPALCETSVGDTGSGKQDCVYGPCVKSGKPEQPCFCDQVTNVPY
jgi:hypothetical protein